MHKVPTPYNTPARIQTHDLLSSSMLSGQFTNHYFCGSVLNRSSRNDKDFAVNGKTIVVTLIPFDVLMDFVFVINVAITN
jgi:hypothetical protein